MGNYHKSFDDWIVTQKYRRGSSYTIPSNSANSYSSQAILTITAVPSSHSTLGFTFYFAI